jgi:hypothetical protein
MYQAISDFGGFIVGLLFILFLAGMAIFAIVWVICKIIDIRIDRRKNTVSNEQVRSLRTVKENI